MNRATLDTRILNLLIDERLQRHNFGMPSKRIGMELGIDDLKKIAGKLKSLEHRGLVECIRTSCRIRWQATAKAIDERVAGGK